MAGTMTKIDHEAALEWAANLSGQAFSNDRNIALTYIAMHAEHKLLETKLAAAKAEVARLTFEEMFHIESVLDIFLKETADKQARVIDVIRAAQEKITAILEQANRDGLIDFKALEASKVKLRPR